MIQYCNLVLFPFKVLTLSVYALLQVKTLTLILQDSALPPFSVRSGPLSSTIRRHSTAVTETSLAKQENVGCFERNVCAVGTMSGRTEEMGRFVNK